jgi:FkbM family methyltransferase
MQLDESIVTRSEKWETVNLSGSYVFVKDGIYSQKIVDVLRSGHYESRERQLVEQILLPKDRVIEIGSAIGSVSMAAARIVGPNSILCFEANKKLIEDATDNFALNNLPIKIVNAILKNRICWSGIGSSVPFYIHNEFWESSLVKSSGTIDTVAVDSLCLEQQIHTFSANVLVCDIEGGEVELLELADLTGIDKILIEIHYWAGRESSNRLIRKLIFDGFSIDFSLTAGQVVVLHRGLLPEGRVS